MKLKLNTASVFSDLKILYHQGKQYIPDVTTVEVPGIFRGRPVISATARARARGEKLAGAAAAAVGRGKSRQGQRQRQSGEESRQRQGSAAAVSLCPVGAISEHPLSIDMGKCVFCGECERKFPEIFQFYQRLQNCISHA